MLESGEPGIVVSNERNILGDGAAGVGEGLEAAEGGEVVGGEDGSGMLVRLEELLNAERSTLLGVGAAGDHRLQAVRPHRSLITTSSTLGPGPATTVDVRDSLVAERNEVIHRNAGTNPVINGHAVDGPRPGGACDQDDRNRSSGLVDRLHVDQRSSEDQAISLEFQEHLEGDGFAFRLPLAAIEERPVPTLEGPILDTVDEVGEERIVEVREHHAEHVRSLLHQAPRHCVGSIAEFVDGLQHRGPPLVADVRRFLYHERNQ